MAKEMSPEARIHKAKQRRYKKPLVKNLNFDAINEWLWEISETCEDIRWAYGDDMEALINALDGDENEAFEFRFAFSGLANDCERLRDDLGEEWVPECFDIFFASSGVYDDFGGMLGYDSYEGDYFGIDGLESWAEDEAKAKLMRLTKEELIASVRQCMKVFTAYVSLRDRYDNLKDSMDILKDKNLGLAKMLTQIDEQYEKACKAGLKYEWKPEVQALDRMLESLPDEMWLA